MKKLDPDKIFSFFTQDEIEPEHFLESREVSDTTILITVVRNIESYYFLDDISERKYGEAYIYVRNKVKTRYFNHLYKFLSRMKLDSIEALQEAMIDLGHGGVEFSLNDLMEFFITVEEYEKCAYIKRLLDICLDIEVPSHV
jgi:hypothetical protein